MKTWSGVPELLIITMLLLGWCGWLIYWRPKPEAGGFLDRFNSYEELLEYLRTHGGCPSPSRRRIGPIIIRVFKSEMAQPSPSMPMYSTTNIQVAGVDEADVVKTDGRYLYLASGCNVVILRAYPPEELEILSTIRLNSTVAGLYIHGDRLAILSSLPLIYPVAAPVWGCRGQVYSIHLVGQDPARGLRHLESSMS